MPKRISGVSARLLECAKSEFLEKGFQDASIREIAKKADTSSRAVYTRFPNKEGLFDAIVGPATEKLIALYRDYGDTYWAEYQTTLVDGVAAGPGKFDICSFGGAAVGRNKQLPVRFLRVADIVNGRFQR